MLIDHDDHYPNVETRQRVSPSTTKWALPKFLEPHVQRVAYEPWLHLSIEMLVPVKVSCESIVDPMGFVVQVHGRVNFLNYTPN